MSLEELAPYLIRQETVEAYGYDVKVYMSPIGIQYLDYDNAINECYNWLNSEYNETNLSCEGM